MSESVFHCKLQSTVRRLPSTVFWPLEGGNAINAGPQFIGAAASGCLQELTCLNAATSLGYVWFVLSYDSPAAIWIIGSSRFLPGRMFDGREPHTIQSTSLRFTFASRPGAGSFGAYQGGSAAIRRVYRMGCA